MDKRSEELAQELIRRAQEYEREAKKLFEAAKIINPNILEIDGPIQIERVVEAEIPGVKKTNKDKIVAALTGKKGLKLKELRALLPDMKPTTLAHTISHDKKTFTNSTGKWYLAGDELMEGLI
jgi:hypothetical protein